MFRLCTLIGLALAAPLFGAVSVLEDFSADPAARGWKVFGDASQFRWNSSNQNLQVTWDSSRANSYFYRPLGNILSRSDDFNFGFELRLQDIAIGTTSNKNYTFQIAVGLMNFGNATNGNFYRGSGVNAVYGPKNLVEFDYFPDSGFGATFAPTVVSSNNVIVFSDNHPLELTAGDLFQFQFSYTSSNHLLHTSVLKNGQPFGMPPDNSIADLDLSGVPDFRVDALAVMSYSDANQPGPAQFHGSILAHGVLDNFSLSMPDPPVMSLRGALTNQTWQAQFLSRTNWIYLLEGSPEFLSWSGVSLPANGSGVEIVLHDTNTISSSQFYRVKAWRAN
jgi:hypothetical protein